MHNPGHYRDAREPNAEIDLNQEGTFPLQLPQLRPARQNHDFSEGEGQLRLSRAVTSILRFDFKNKTWLKAQTIYKHLKFKPNPTRQEFLKLFHDFPERFHHWKEWSFNETTQDWSFESWYILRDPIRDAQMLQEAEMLQRQQDQHEDGQEPLQAN